MTDEINTGNEIPEDRVEMYRNMVLENQAPVLPGVEEIDQDPELFSLTADTGLYEGARMAVPGTPYTNTANALLAQLRTYLGMGENPPNTNDITREYNRLYKIGTNSFAWCDAAITLGALHSNNELPVLGGAGKCFAYTPSHAGWFKKIGRLHWGLAKKPGQIQFFRWKGAANTTAVDHVGTAESIRSDGTVTMLEGNSKNKFIRVVRDRKYAACYGDPDFLTPNPDQWRGRYLRLKSPMMHGSDVKWVQVHLNDILPADLDTDGIFGKLTKAKVLTFQKSKRLAADGIVGPVTWNALARG